MSRRLAAFSAKKQERMKYADPNDHQFNWSSKFVNRGVYENVYPSSYGRPADREPKILPKLSNLDVEEEDELINAMQEIGVHEKELEDAKIKLVRCSDFNLVDGFQTVDALGKGFVTAPQLQNALEDLGLFTHKDDIATFIKRFDKDDDGKLVYSDFCDAFTPLDPHYGMMVTQRPADFIHRSLAPMYYFTTTTRETLVATWRKIFESEESIELVKQRLARRPKLTAKAAFEYLDAQETGFLSMESLKRIFVNNKYYPSEEDLLLLLHRFDKTKNGRVTLGEFMDEIAPKHTVNL